MASLSPGGTVKDQKSFLGDGHFHPGRLSYDHQVGGGQHLQERADPSLPGILFFGGGRKNQVKGEVPQRVKMEEGGQQGHHGSPGIVAPQSGDAVTLLDRHKGIGVPAAGRLHRIDVGVEPDHRLPLFKKEVDSPGVVPRTAVKDSLFLQKCTQNGGGLLLPAAQGRNRDERLE